MPNATTPILDVSPLGFPWKTLDPFLFCVHHDDAYPSGNERMGPNASLAGRRIGEDFEGRDGWRMYHGDVIPGFPQHPHRGFETITVARKGFIDHSDSLGATARFGAGDVQWMTAGKGIVHSEMFPLVQREAGNPLELFQIWLNLPKADKLVAPHFSMFWDHSVPKVKSVDAAGKQTEVTVIAGKLGEAKPPSPPPHSWASRAGSDIAIWSLKLSPWARYTLPAGPAKANRTAYFFRGAALGIDSRSIQPKSAVALLPHVPVTLEAGAEGAELLLLQGRPIGEPVVQYGPFVMNTREEIQQAFADFHRDGFGGWPWPDHGPVHARDAGRHAKHADGRTEKADEVRKAPRSK